MKNKILKLIVLAFICVLITYVNVFAAILDPSIPNFDANLLSLNSDGTASFVAPAYTGGYKRYDIQLMERRTISDTTGNLVFTYKTRGSVQHVDPGETEYEFTISATGYYQFQIRGVNLEGNYGNWVAIYDNSTWSTQKTSYPGVSVTEDDINAGGGNNGSGSGIGSDINYGPGVVNQNYLPYGYQYAIIGPNGEILYNYGNNYNYQAQGSAYQNGYYGPGYNTNGAQTFYPNTGVSSYPQVQSPFNYGTAQSGTQGMNQNSQTNPNYYNGQGTSTYTPGSNATGSPQVSQGLEIGWHVDNNGRFYYQGNGVVLKGTWYLIDGSYYRFSDNGYILANQWYKDNTTGYWYFLGGDGKMLVGWQNINGTWYYFKPENGNGYGTLYMNTTLQITDNIWGTGVYAFDANGATVMNAWYGGFYYGSDGKRTN